MYLPNKQQALLYEILDGFDLPSPVDIPTLGIIYCYLFSPLADTTSFIDPALKEIVLTLKDIVETEHLTSLEGIAAFFENEDRFIDDCAREIAEEIERAHQKPFGDEEDGEADGDVAVMGPRIAVKPALSRFVVAANQFSGEQFVSVFEEQYRQLYTFFAMRLRFHSIEGICIDDLMQDTAMGSWITYIELQLQSHMIEEILWKEAEYLFYEKYSCFQITKKQVPLNESIKDASPPHDISYEVTNTVDYLRDVMNKDLYFVYEQLAAGYTYREISFTLKVPERNLREEIHRSRVELRKLAKKLLLG